MSNLKWVRAELTVYPPTKAIDVEGRSICGKRPPQGHKFWRHELSIFINV